MKIRFEARELGASTPLAIALRSIWPCTLEGPLNPEEAYERERPAIRSGDVVKAAMAPDAPVVTRGVLGMLGSPHQSDVQTGLFLISSKANHDPFAQLALGLQCIDGTNMPVDFHRGEVLLTRAKEGSARSSPAWRNASLALAVLQAMTERRAEGLKTFEEFAMQEGDAHAAYLAGLCHCAEAHASGREEDLRNAIDFLHLAIAQDHHDAMKTLADLLHEWPYASAANLAEAAAWLARLKRLEVASSTKSNRKKAPADLQVA